MKGINDLMKKAQDMQKKMQESQAELVNLEVQGEAGAGLIKVVMNGRHDVRRVSIDPSLMSEDKEMLEDLLAAAVNDCVRRVEKQNQEKMQSLASGVNLPDGFKFPF